MAGQRTPPRELNFSPDNHRFDDNNSNGEVIHMSDLENPGGYRPLHLNGRRSSIFEHNETFPPNSMTNPYVVTF